MYTVIRTFCHIDTHADSHPFTTAVTPTRTSPQSCCTLLPDLKCVCVCPSFGLLLSGTEPGWLSMVPGLACMTSLHVGILGRSRSWDWRWPSPCAGWGRLCSSPVRGCAAVEWGVSPVGWRPGRRQDSKSHAGSQTDKPPGGPQQIHCASCKFVFQFKHALMLESISLN